MISVCSSVNFFSMNLLPSLPLDQYKILASIILWQDQLPTTWNPCLFICFESGSYYLYLISPGSWTRYCENNVNNWALSAPSMTLKTTIIASITPLFPDWKILIYLIIPNTEILPHFAYLFRPSMEPFSVLSQLSGDSGNLWGWQKLLIV